MSAPLPTSSVLTLELTPLGTREVRRDADLAQASAGLPDGAYTTMRTYGERGLVRFEDHLQRLEESAAAVAPAATLDRDGARRLVTAALDASSHPESRLRFTFAPPRLFVSVEPFTPLPRARFERGVGCVTLPHIHRDRPHVKDTHFIARARQAYGTLPEGVEEGLLVADDGSLLEGLTSNFFAVREGTLYTEHGRVLAGITRALVLEAARPLVSLAGHALRLEELPLVQECFITSTSRGVLPVVRVDAETIADGSVGPTTRAIRDAFDALVRGEADTRF